MAEKERRRAAQSEGERTSKADRTETRNRYRKQPLPSTGPGGGTVGATKPPKSK